MSTPPASEGLASAASEPGGVTAVVVAPQRAVALLRTLCIVVVGSLLVGAYAAGLFERVRDPASFAAAVVGMGAWGYAGFVLAYAALQPFGVPGTVFVVAAPLIWPWDVAFALSMTGTMAASCVGFSFARFVGRDFVLARLPARLLGYEAALTRSAFRTVFALRLVLWMPQMLHVFFGVSRVSFRTHFFASLLGYVPPLLAVSLLGGRLFDGTGAVRPEAMGWMAALAGFSLAVAYGIYRLDQRERRMLSAAGDDGHALDTRGPGGP